MVALEDNLASTQELGILLLQPCLPAYLKHATRRGYSILAVHSSAKFAVAVRLVGPGIGRQEEFPISITSPQMAQLISVWLDWASYTRN